MKPFWKAAIGAILSAALIFGAGAAAQAGDRGRDIGVGVAAGIIGLGLLGAAAQEDADRRAGYYGRGEYCHPGPLVCREVAPPCFYNDYGDYICPAPGRRCFRREYCD